MTTTTPTPVLKPGVIYAAGAQFVCCKMRCAGQTALYTGRTYEGADLRPISGRDVIEVASVRPGPLTCECGRLAATFSMVDGLRVERVARH